MWAMESYTLELLKNLTSSKVEIRWNDVKHRVFEDIKQFVSHNNLLAYQYFNKIFEVNINDINFQLSVLVSQ